MLIAALRPRLARFVSAHTLDQLSPEATPLELELVHRRLVAVLSSLRGYVPHDIVRDATRPGQVRQRWRTGALLATDISGFSAMAQAFSGQGPPGVQQFTQILNQFLKMVVETLARSEGNLLEFLGDATIAAFEADPRGAESERAARAGLRLQQDMGRFQQIAAGEHRVSMSMRIGVHVGRFLTAEVGTVHRMEGLLLGRAVHQTRAAETAGVKGRVSASPEFLSRLGGRIGAEPGREGYSLLAADISSEQLGSFELSPPTSRLRRTGALYSRERADLLRMLTAELAEAEALACYLPGSFLRQIVHDDDCRAPASFVHPTVLFLNLLGFSGAAEAAASVEVGVVVEAFSNVFTCINTVVEDHGGVLKKVTSYLRGSDVMILFGVPEPLPDAAGRALSAAQDIRRIVEGLPPLIVAGQAFQIRYRMGINQGLAFAGDIGEPNGRREYNVVGDTINTAARLMSAARPGEILLSPAVAALAPPSHRVEPDPVPRQLKGRPEGVPVFTLLSG